MKNSKMIRTEYARRYIEAVFAQPLKNAGFFCPDDKLLCWYRSRSDEVINSIVFRSLWPQLPLFLEIRYGIIPSFAMPIRIKSVVNNAYPDEELFVGQPIIEDWPNGGTQARFSEDIWVYAPIQGGRGRYTLDKKLLPIMDQLQTIEEAYHFHKKRRATSKINNGAYGQLTTTFINMAIWANDNEMYPYAIMEANKAVELYRELSTQFPKKHSYTQEYVSWKRLQEVLINGDLNRYKEELSATMERNKVLFHEEYLSESR